MLQCGLCSESIEEIFDESTVKKYVKSDLGNSSWVIGSGYNRILGHLFISGSFIIPCWSPGLCAFTRKIITSFSGY